MGLFSIFNNKTKEALARGAVIIDVRTASEFDRGKAPGSINIPLDRIVISVGHIRSMNKTIVLVDDADGRAGAAATILKANDIKDVINGGRWTRVLKIVRSL
jgi:phage shock protein E